MASVPKGLIISVGVFSLIALGLLGAIIASLAAMSH